MPIFCNTNGTTLSGVVISYNGINYSSGGGATYCCDDGAGSPSLSTAGATGCYTLYIEGVIPDPLPPWTVVCASGSCSFIIENINLSVIQTFDACPTFYYTWEVIWSCECDGSKAYSSSTFSFSLNGSESVPPCASGGPEPVSIYSNLARFADWKFEVPQEATVLGIEATISKQTEDPKTPTSDSIVKLMRNHRQTGKNKAKLDDLWKTENEFVKYGNMVDTWGIQDLSPDDINSEGFGIAIEVENASDNANSKAFLNSIQLDIYYKVNDDVTVISKLQDWDGAVYPLF